MESDKGESDREISAPERWVDRHGDAMYRYALLRVRDAGLAQDLVQEALVSALGARDRFVAGSSERTWLIAILKHKVMDHFRASSRGTGSADIGIEDIDSAMEQTFTARGLWNGGPCHWRGDPRAAMERREFWDVFRRCLSELPDDLGNAFCLREVEQLSAEEVCQVLGISATNLWARLHRARTRLRKCLEVHWFSRDKGCD